MTAQPTTAGVEERWSFIRDVYLPVYEDAEAGDPRGDAIYDPPSRVLCVNVVADRAFVSVKKYEQTHDVTTATDIISECVSAEALLNALVIQMGIEYVQGILRQRP